MPPLKPRRWSQSLPAKSPRAPLKLAPAFAAKLPPGRPTLAPAAKLPRGAAAKLPRGAAAKPPPPPPIWAAAPPPTWPPPPPKPAPPCGAAKAAVAIVAAPKAAAAAIAIIVLRMILHSLSKTDARHKQQRTRRRMVSVRRVDQMPRAARLPKFCRRTSVHYLGDAFARRACRFGRQRVGCEETVRHDLVVRLRQRVLEERAHHIERDVIAPRDAPVEIDAEQRRRLHQFDI